MSLCNRCPVCDHRLNYPGNTCPECEPETAGDDWFAIQMRRFPEAPPLNQFTETRGDPLALVRREERVAA